MLALRPDNPLAVAVTEAIRSGDLAALKRLLGNNPGLATARIGTSRTAKLRLVGFGPACHFPEHLRGSSGAKLAHPVPPRFARPSLAPVRMRRQLARLRDSAGRMVIKVSYL
jgi:hypothetical protein